MSLGVLVATLLFWSIANNLLVPHELFAALNSSFPRIRRSALNLSGRSRPLPGEKREARRISGKVG